jgi:hypothetical protein
VQWLGWSCCDGFDQHIIAYTASFNLLQHVRSHTQQQHSVFIINTYSWLLLSMQSLRSRALQKPGSAAVPQQQLIASAPAADSSLVSCCRWWYTQ